MQAPMTQPEAIVKGWLARHNFKYDFQTSLMGGFFELGGAVLDFILIESNIGIRVHGEYWHQGIAKQGRDLIQKEQLLSLGFTAIVDVWEDDVLNRLNETMELAVQGIEMIH